MFLLMYLQAFSVLTSCFAKFSMTDVARLSGSMPASSFGTSGPNLEVCNRTFE